MGYPHYSNDCYEYWKTVTICGSMRFYEQMLHVAERLTLEGWIVLMPFVRKDAAMTNGTGHPGNVAEKLDELHRRKIDLSRQIVVVSDETGYIGDSTRSEIVYAGKTGKGVVYEQVAPPRPAFAPFAPVPGSPCTCVDPFSNCPTHG